MFRGCGLVIIGVVFCLNGAFAHTLVKEDPNGCGTEVLKEATEAEMKAAWGMTAQGLKKITDQFRRKKSLVRAAATTLLSHDFAWISGDPGGAKTLISRTLMQAELDSIDDETKRIFIIQFHKLMSEVEITGVPVLNEFLKGILRIEKSTSLVGDAFIFAILDEMEKASPAVLASLLSVLNERKAFLGGEVVNCLLLAGFATSNKTVAQFLDSFEQDRPTGEALLDRFLMKHILVNQGLTHHDDAELFKLLNRRKESGNNPITALHKLNPLMKKIKIPAAVMRNAVKIISELDSQLTRASDKTLEARRLDPNSKEPIYIPSSQFSNRTVRRIIRLMKASFLVEQLMEGCPEDQIRWEMDNPDLVHLALGSIFGGPGEIRTVRTKFSVKMKGEAGAIRPNVPIEVDAFHGVVYYRDFNEPEVIRSFSVDTTTGAISDNGLLKDAGEKQQISDLVVNFKRSKVEFEDDGVLDSYINVPTLTEGAREELKLVKKERGLFVTLLNGVLSAAKPAREAPRLQPTGKKRLFLSKVGEWHARLTELNNKALSPEEALERSWLLTQLSVQKLHSSYLEVDHVINAHIVGMLSKTHLWAFGPAGGAKTSLSSDILYSELYGVNLGLEAEQRRDVFFLQFHKLIPQSMITGLVDIESQMSTGKIKYYAERCLVHPRYIFALLDESEKGSPAVLTSLLGVLNENEAYLGSTVLEGKLEFAVLTSNKTGFEFIDGFGADRSDGEALLARALNKVYVANKFSDPEVLVEFLLSTEEAVHNPPPPDPNPVHLSVRPLRELVDKVEVSDEMVLLASELQSTFFRKSKTRADFSEAKYDESAAENPFVYRQANLKSDRAVQGLLREWKSAFIARQLLDGVEFKDIRFKMFHEDLALVADGLLYWTPSRLRPIEANGILQFEVDMLLKKMNTQPYFNQRQKHAMGYMQTDLTEFTDSLNHILRRSALQKRDIIARHPNLFPGLIRNQAAFNQFAATHAASGGAGTP